MTVQEPARRADVNVVWEGGAATTFGLNLNKTGKHFRATDEDTVDLVRRLAARYDDKTIAAILSKQRRRTGTGLAFTQTRVKTLRVSRGIPANDGSLPSPPSAVKRGQMKSGRPPRGLRRLFTQRHRTSNRGSMLLRLLEPACR